MSSADIKPTDEQRTQVAIAAGGGMSHEEIALGLGIGVDVLEALFGRELSEGAYLARAQVLAALHGAALKGNASAAREYLSGSPEVAAPPAPAGVEAPTPPKKLGKKEQAQEDAKGATKGTGWAALLKPQRMQ